MTWLAVAFAAMAVAALLPSAPRAVRRRSAATPGLRPLAVGGVAIGAWLLVGGFVGVLVAVSGAESAEMVAETMPRAEVVTVSLPMASTVPVPPSAVVPDWVTTKAWPAGLRMTRVCAALSVAPAW